MRSQPLVRMMSAVQQFGVKPDDSYGVRSKKLNNVVSCLVVSVLFLAFHGPIQVLNGEPLGGWLHIGYALFLLAQVAIFGWVHRNVEILAWGIMTGATVASLAHCVLMGGLLNSGGSFLWGLPIVVGIVINFSPRQAVPWLIAYLLGVAAIAALEPSLHQTALPLSIRQLLLVVNFCLICAYQFAVFASFVNQNRSALQLIRSERTKSNNLLLSILPAEIASILKEEQRTIADHFAGASVLFADVVNFTPLSTTMTPIELVEMLNEVFSSFDDLAEKYGVEKIKTIGDCYMVAAGVPRSQPDHAQTLVRMALEMQDLMRQRSFMGHQLAFRIGINSGPVVAGVIGRKKFIYDLWGDAVNTASRMESHGQSGVIQITSATYQLLDGQFVCEAKGQIEVKGKGLMDIWHVIGEVKK